MTKTDLHILMLEDEPLDAELNKAQLALLDEYNCIINVVCDKASYLNALSTTSPDIILSDYNLPQYNGLDALYDLNSMNLLIPFVFVTGTMNEEIAAGTIKAGAWDYVVKDRLFRLPLAVRSALQLKDEKLSASIAEEKINRLLTAIEQTSAQIIVANEHGVIDYVNKKFTEVTGLSPDDVIGKDSLTLSQEDSIPFPLEKLINGEVYRGEVLSAKRDGSTFWEMVTITPIFSTEGNVTSFVAVREDITRRKLMEQQLVEARNKAESSDKLKDAFLQNLSHEIRTPLNAIVGFSDLLNKSIENTNERLKEYTSIIHESSHQLLSIVTDVLTMSIIETGQEKPNIKPVDINKLLDHLYDVFLPVAKVKNLKLIIVPPLTSKSSIIQTDDTKVTQILTNLINNALKFTQQGSVELKCNMDNASVDFIVKDTGIGIAKESQDIIFERFRQAEDSIHTEYGGTGLGLSISKSYADMLGGKIYVESVPGHGSTFTFSLPYSPAISPFNEKLQSILPQDKKITILVAEDEITNYILLKAYLNHPNITLIYAEDGQEAIKACENNPQIDMVLMDIKMPVMDGVAAFEKIHVMRKELPVIAQTAYGLQTEKFHFLDLGFNGYISKPINKEDLLDTIQKCMIQ